MHQRVKNAKCFLHSNVHNKPKLESNGILSAVVNKSLYQNENQIFVNDVNQSFEYKYRKFALTR